MFFDPIHKEDGDQRKEPSLDLAGLIFIGVLLLIPLARKPQPTEPGVGGH